MSFNTPDAIDDSPVGILLPMGKYVGVPVAEAPLQYLAWAYGAWRFTTFPELQRAIERRLGVPPDPQIRTGPPPAAQPPAQTQPIAKVTPSNGPSNGHVARPAKPESGLDGFRKAFDRCRREALMEYQDEPEITQLLEDVLARVQHALGI